MKKSIIVVASLLVGTISFGQNAGTFGFTNTQITTQQYFEQYGIVEAKLHTIKGSPYDNPLFLPGNIYSSNEIVGAGVMLRYNIFADEIEIKDPTSDSYSSLIKSPEFFAKINNDLYMYVLGENGGYFKVLTEGKNYDLYKKSTVIYRDVVPPKDPYSRETPAQFTRNDIYYIVSKGGSFYELPNNRKKFVSIFKSNQKEIDQYIKKNKIDLKDEKDMIKVMNHIDSLIKE
jgi:hypothetical protein